MANQNYTLINAPTIEIEGKSYSASTWNMKLEEFLITHTGKEIYIVASSVQSDRIRAIVK